MDKENFCVDKENLPVAERVKVNNRSRFFLIFFWGGGGDLHL